ncbi:C40 family peptidase [Mycobacterium koreense]|uniref:Uncharacterized protein n=1 Tax=Mycolicibacillus koreensis TaxID=1069220 RepID=A0A7I7SB07_9MYCO|nr:NlpC/P60 family protein [Mycolicibacillus koreensis]MCV7247687.1 C40 family peptidase [Mycolicibacillus koreensis]OSC34777.1 hypothetical protein B8W67_05890 [Mycolicibacillus koreensis]BBY54072.1 hypothetical protein MKOR_13230 [Mycolicibacillus koreensis]
MTGPGYSISTDNAVVQGGSDAARSEHDATRARPGMGPGNVDPRVSAATDDTNKEAEKLRRKAGEGIDKTKADSRGKTDIDNKGAANVSKGANPAVSALGKAGQSLLGSLSNIGGGSGGGGTPQMPQMPQMPGGLPSMMDPANFKSMIDGTGDGNSTGGLNIGGRGNTGVGGPGSVGSTEFEKTLLDRAREVVAADIPYSWGSGDLNGPTCSGTRDGGAADAAGDYAKTGFDCSGLSRYLIYQASGIEIPRLSQDQYASGMEVSPSDARIGDLVFPDYSFNGGGPGHVQVYVGDGKVVEAQQSGTSVMFSDCPSGRFVRYINS